MARKVSLSLRCPICGATIHTRDYPSRYPKGECLCGDPACYRAYREQRGAKFDEEGHEIVKITERAIF